MEADKIFPEKRLNSEERTFFPSIKSPEIFLLNPRINGNAIFPRALIPNECKFAVQEQWLAAVYTGGHFEIMRVHYFPRLSCETKP